VSTNALSQLLGGQQRVGFHKSFLCMDPPGLDGVEPRTFGRQKKGQNAHPCVLFLHLLIVLSDPGLHLLAVMPGGIIPDQEPVVLALLLQPGADPFQKWGRKGADWTPIHQTQRHQAADGIGDWTLLPKNPVAGEGFWIRIILLPNLFHQANRVIFALPRIQNRQGKPAPPHLIQKADGPARLLARPGDQPIACVFFNRYCGSGLLIHCLARFQLFPNRLRARRILSPETRRGVSPCWKLIWAARDKVHTLVSRPKS